MTLVDTGATLSVLTLSNWSCLLFQSKASVQMVGISNQPMSIFKSEPVPFQLGNVMSQHIFLLVNSVPIHLLGRDFLESHDAHISFSQKGKIYLELNDSDTEPIGNVMISKESPQELTNLDTEWLLQDIPMQLWALCSTDIDKIKSSTPIKITTDNTLPPYNIHRYPLRLDAIAGIKAIIQEYLNRRLIIPCTNPCNLFFQ